MIAILLCPGFVTRMYPITKDFPKPLLKVADRQVLDYLMDQMVLLPELDSVYIVTNDLFYKKFYDWKYKWHKLVNRYGIKFELLNDGATNNENRLAAIRDLAYVLKSIKEKSPTIIAAGDNIFRFSLRPVAQEFINSERNIVIALEETFYKEQRRKGLIEIGKDGRVLKFYENPLVVKSALSCPPIYFLQQRALNYLEDYLARPDAEDAPGHFISYLLEREQVYAIKIHGKRLDIGTIESYENAKRILSREPVILS